MHELLLVAQVPLSRHETVLQVLAGISGMKPQPIIERHIVYKPKKADAAAIKAAANKVQDPKVKNLLSQLHGELYYMQLVGEIPAEAFPDPVGAAASGDVMIVDDSNDKSPSKSALETQRWTLVFNDLPEVAGRRPVTSRLIAGVEHMDKSVFELLKNLRFE
jgi:mediator of RNA polymerase II transcription subunit 18